MVEVGKQNSLVWIDSIGTQPDPAVLDELLFTIQSQYVNPGQVEWKSIPKIGEQ